MHPVDVNQPVVLFFF